MRKTRFAGAAASLTAAAMLLTACGTGTGTGSEAGSGADDLVDRIAAVTDDQLDGVTITMSRMFGDCEETTQGVTDPSLAASECEAIQILTNQFNAENEYGITVERLGGADWHSYYDAFNASVAGGDPADIANLHDYSMSDYAQRDQLLAFDPEAVGIDLSDSTAQAQSSVVYDDKTYAVPFDSHAILAHINTDILGAAGYMGEDGRPIMPTSADELLEMAAAVKEKTGTYLFSLGVANDDMAWRMFYSLVRQQGSDVVSADGEAQIDTPEAAAALELMNELIEGGYIHTDADYAGSIDEWKSGKSAILVNGTWVVNEYAATAPFGYAVTDFPALMGEPAVWASSHMWVLPRQRDDDPVAYRAALEFASFLYDNTDVWAVATGHIAPRVSVVESDAYQAAPNREFYTSTALNDIRFVPQIDNWTAVKDLIHTQLEEVWFNGKDVAAALAEAQSRVEQQLD
ncbi:extracellular solute-binding protein [Microbacterium sp. zg.Y1090]|uniref:extracellular solute-binding protein n=1 Tax=Microbacterium TaxID=33882 RepID=UPI00214B227A|nr:MULTISPECIES: extracellular solute-binding protein [unclassified Microbacterium]MCR2813668.1 extracellular solute-binding protein [Microbacterium sp. zg.Y1084]MCR2817999.1 extracellular solute-binding protein [Microbacterium sp. zg.Y1090]MDL5488083.1 extracellular solute-binding protein [Microbacterium sp. zg-Y1211]WIM27839.1 extracellular solute-binding protein [Microbacterium sp. zg-Y1090]